MRPASLFPEELQYRVFTVEQSRELGVPRGRLRAQDITPLHRGLYSHGSAKPSEAGVAAGLCLAYRGAWASHLTAARIHKFWLPAYLESPAILHLTRYRSKPLEVNGIVSHRLRSFKGDVVSLPPPVDGPPDAPLVVSTMLRTWFEVASILRMDDLVAAGDQLVRLPYRTWEERADPYASVPELHELLERYRGFPGAGRARAALAQVRIGSDSVQETKLRLALVRAGLPEPELQIRLDPASRYSPSCDMGYPAHRVAIQYDGAHHRTANQLSTDNRRDHAFTSAGWTYLKFDWSDAANGFVRAVGLVRKALAAAA